MTASPVTAPVARPITLPRLLQQNRSFRNVFIAQIVSQGGDWFTMVPLIILLDQLTGQGALGALLLGVETLAIAALSPVVGTVIDRVDQRRLLVLCQLASAVAVLLLLFVRSETTAWIAVLTYGLLAATKAFSTPTANTILPRIVSPSELLTANAAISSLWGVMLALGASLGGLASAATTPYVCFVFTSVAFAVSGGLLTKINPRPVTADASLPRAANWSVARDLRATFQYCRANPKVLSLVFAKPASYLGNGAIALFPAVAVALMADSALAASFLFAARGVGALIGPIVAKQMVSRGVNLRTGIFLGVTFFGIGYLALPFVSTIYFALALVIFAHIGGSMNASLSGFGLQVLASESHRGRLFAMDNMFAMLAIGTSQMLVSLLVLFVDERAIVFAFGGAVLLLGIIWRLFAAGLTVDLAHHGQEVSSTSSEEAVLDAAR